MSHDVFISYSTQDHDIINKIVKAIEDNKIKCWYCERNIEKVSPDSWSKQVVNSIATARVVMLVLSQNANRSRWVHREIGVAATKKKGILVLRTENVEPADEILLVVNGITWHDYFSLDSEDARRKLISAIKNAIFTGDPKYVPTVEEFIGYCREEKYYEAICMPSYASPEELESKIKKFESVHKGERLRWRIPMTSVKKALIGRPSEVDLTPGIDLKQLSPPDPKARELARTLVFKASIMETKGQIEKGLELCEEAIKADPSCWWGYHKRAWLSLMLKDYIPHLDRVIEDSKIALSAKPDGDDDPDKPAARPKPIFGSILNDIGRAYDRKRDLEKARSTYMRSIEIYPQLTIAMLNLMSVEIRSRMFNDAISTYDRFVTPRLSLKEERQEYRLIGSYLLCTAFALEGEDYSDWMGPLDDRDIKVRSTDIWNNDSIDLFIDTLEKDGYYPGRVSEARALQALFKSHYNVKVKKAYDHDIFVAHAVDQADEVKDRMAAEAMVSALEAAGMKCWYDIRDVDRERLDETGMQYSEAIYMSRLFLLVLSDAANKSEYIASAIKYAGNIHKDVIAVRIEDVKLSDAIANSLSPDAIIDALGHDTGKCGEMAVNSVKKALERPVLEEAAPPGCVLPHHVTKNP